MKKRIRKKKHLGEFREYGVSINLSLTNKKTFNDFLDEFTEKAIEGNNCFFGGGGNYLKFSGIIELGQSDLIDTRKKHIIKWLDNNSKIKSYKTGELFDLWHGSP